jgi:hypothetical protein
MASSSSVAEFRFRDATIDDVPAIMALILEVARFENEPLENVKTNEQTLARDGFSDSEPKFKVILADHIDSSQNQATKVAGMAFYYFGYSTLAGLSKKTTTTTLFPIYVKVHFDIGWSLFHFIAFRLSFKI